MTDIRESATLAGSPTKDGEQADRYWLSFDSR
jgi:hypothetical protein